MSATKNQHSFDEDQDEVGILESTVDPKEWLMEVERVTAKLRVRMPQDSKEWRSHLAQTQEYFYVVKETFPRVQSWLGGKQRELEGLLSRIEAREASMNTQFQPQMEQHVSILIQLNLVLKYILLLLFFIDVSFSFTHIYF
eukprot:GHVR01080335.1.p1 GENE.GHVR01080335.1~~GHVR01080335.1.p1  ORF type:complete len:141 (+),score=29.08 GHVR01080335.1:511-933(+)